MAEVENSQNHNSNPTPLDAILSKLDNTKDQDVHQQVFARQPSDLNFTPKPPREKLFKDLGWYWPIIRPVVLFLAGLEIATYVLSLNFSWNRVMLEVVNPLLLIVNLVFFAGLMIRMKRRHKQSLWQGLVACFLAGFGFGLIMAMFKSFWIRQFWTIFNLIVEPVFMGLVAAVAGLIIGIFVKRRRI